MEFPIGKSRHVCLSQCVYLEKLFWDILIMRIPSNYLRLGSVLRCQTLDQKVSEVAICYFSLCRHKHTTEVRMFTFCTSWYYLVSS